MRDGYASSNCLDLKLKIYLGIITITAQTPPPLNASFSLSLNKGP
jgi:hypothetical protein